MSDAICVEYLQRSVVVRFSRPGIRNPLSVAILEQLDEIIDRLGDDIDAMIFAVATGPTPPKSSKRSWFDVFQERFPT